MYGNVSSGVTGGTKPAQLESARAEAATVDAGGARIANVDKGRFYDILGQLSQYMDIKNKRLTNDALNVNIDSLEERLKMDKYENKKIREADSSKYDPALLRYTDKKLNKLKTLLNKAMDKGMFEYGETPVSNKRMKQLREKKRSGQFLTQYEKKLLQYGYEYKR